MSDDRPQLLPSIRAGSALEDQLRESLETLARHGSPELRQRITAILRGDASLRDLATSADFMEIAAPAAARAASAFRAMLEEQRRELAVRAEQDYGSSFA